MSAVNGFDKYDLETLERWSREAMSEYSRTYNPFYLDAHGLISDAIERKKRSTGEGIDGIQSGR